MKQVLVVVNHGSGKETVTYITQSRKDNTILREYIINHSRRDMDIWVVLGQLFDAVATCQDAYNVNFGDTPLHHTEKIQSTTWKLNM